MKPPAYSLPEAFNKKLSVIESCLKGLSGRRGFLIWFRVTQSRFEMQDLKLFFIQVNDEKTFGGNGIGGIEVVTTRTNKKAETEGVSLLLGRVIASGRKIAASVSVIHVNFKAHS